MDIQPIIADCQKKKEIRQTEAEEEEEDSLIAISALIYSMEKMIFR